MVSMGPSSRTRASCTGWRGLSGSSRCMLPGAVIPGPICPGGSSPTASVSGGAARCGGLEPVHAPESDDAGADLHGRLELVGQRLGAGDTFVFSHLKATDTAGHTKDPAVKQRTIELLDSELGELPTDR